MLPADRRSRGGLVALGGAALALLVAVAALAVSWRALDQAHDARDIALAGRAAPTGQPAVDTTTPSVTDTSAAPAPVDPNSTSAPPLNRQTVYKIKYEKQALTLRAPGYTTMDVDLDEPRADVGNGSDIRLNGKSGGTPTLSLGEGVSASDAGATGMTPQDCADKIRTFPVGQGSELPVRQGVVLCLTTSFAAAKARGDTQRMVLLEITGVGADDAVTVQLTAWDIPG
jgi:hypothetical protein